MIRRPPTMARQGMVVASHPLAAEAGAAALRAGGHAVDAAIAAGAVLAVVEPSASGLGGDAFFLIYDRKDGNVTAINGSGAAPRGLTPELLRSAVARGDARPGAGRCDGPSAKRPVGPSKGRSEGESDGGAYGRSACRPEGRAARRSLGQSVGANGRTVPGHDRHLAARGPLALTVPGCVAAWDEASYGWGRLDWDELLEPALALAEGGFPVSWRVARLLRREMSTLAADTTLAQLYLRGDGRPLRAGDICRPAALARTLRALAEEGPDVFYSGAIAKALARGVREKGGVLDPEDLARHESELRAPVESLCAVSRSGSATVAEMIEPSAPPTRGFLATDSEVPDPQGDVAAALTGLTTLLCEQPLPSQGILLPVVLGLLERAPTESGWVELHRQIEAVRIAFVVRDLFLADPRFLPVPEEELVGALLAPETLNVLADLIRPAKRRRRGEPEIAAASSSGDAALWATLVGCIRAGSSSLHSVFNAYERAGFGPVPSGADGTDTTYLCAADAEGNVVGLIQSVFHPFGGGFVEPSTGILLNNRAAGFSLDPRSVNRIEPGKRPRHTLNSWMLLRDDRPWLVGGTPGADNQIVVNLQILRHLLAGKVLWPGPAPMMDGRWSQARRTQPEGAQSEDIGLIAEALEAPRWDLDPAHGGRVRVEARMPAEIRRRLNRAGQTTVRVGPWDGSGLAQTIELLPDGVLAGNTDPRGEGLAIGLGGGAPVVDAGIPD